MQLVLEQFNQQQKVLVQLECSMPSLPTQNREFWEYLAQKSFSRYSGLLLEHKSGFFPLKHLLVLQCFPYSIYNGSLCSPSYNLVSFFKRKSCRHIKSWNQIKFYYHRSGKIFLTNLVNIDIHSGRILLWLCNRICVVLVSMFESDSWQRSSIGRSSIYLFLRFLVIIMLLKYVFLFIYSHEISVPSVFLGPSAEQFVASWIIIVAIICGILLLLLLAGVLYKVNKLIQIN